MKHLFRNTRLTCLTILIALAMTAPAFAGGTTPGTSIDNTASLAYKIGVTQQTAKTSSVNFVVDRLVDYSLATGGGQTVSPNSTVQTISFTITNDGNDTYDFVVSPSQSGTLTVGSLELVNGSGTVITTIEDLAPDASVILYAKGTIPDTATNGQAATIILTVDAVKDASGGALDNDSADADDATLQTVWDSVTPTISADYTVGAAILSIEKTYRVISDPTGGANPKAITGSVIEYNLKIINAAGASTAVDVTLTDDAPAGTTYLAGTTASDVTGPITDIAGPPPSCPLAVGHNVGDVDAGDTINISFQVTID